MKKYIINENGIGLVFYVSEEGKVAITAFGNVCDRGEPAAADMDVLSPVEIATAETGFAVHHGAKKECGTLSSGLRFRDLQDETTPLGREVKLFLESEEAEVVCQYTFVTGGRKTCLPVLRVYTQVRAKRAYTLEYVSAFRFAGLFPPFDESSYERIHAYIPHNTWHGEGQWKKGTLAEFGLTGNHCGGMHMKRVAYGNTGSWSSKEYLPAGILECDEKCIFWQLETNGSWNVEIGQTKKMPYLAIAGPSFAENYWQKKMQAGDVFVTPAVALSFGETLNACIENFTPYRRSMGEIYVGDKDIPSQYNGYMHANWDFPTTENVMGQIDACAALGIDTFVVDAGWFSQGEFWTVLGDWLHPNEPFVGKTFRQILDYCHQKGMKAGLWMELEDIGIDCPIVNEVDGLLMRRNGIKVRDNRRYFFDFSLPETQAYMDNVVDTVIKRYNVDYIKLDYNCDLGVGCDCVGGSFAEGLLQHNRAFIQWVQRWHERHPNLVIEGCASGGMRLDHLSLSAFALGNTSDQVCYDRTPYIACNLAGYIVPERMGVWAYPWPSQNDLQVNMNLVNAVLFRMQLSGEVHKLNDKQLALVKKGVEYYDSIKDFKRTANAYLPMGYCQFFDKTVAFGLKGEEKILLAVYNLHGDKEKHIPLSGITAKGVKRSFPEQSTAVATLEKDGLCVRFENDEEAAIFEITL